MMPPSPRPQLRRCPPGLSVYGTSLRGALRGAQRWQGWRTRGLVPLGLSGLLLLGAMVLRPPLEAELICSLYSALCYYFECREDRSLPSVFPFITGNHSSNLQNFMRSRAGPLHFSALVVSGIDD